MARIYVSSTFKDLKDFREAVSRALRRLGHTDVAMEDYVAEDQRPVDKCLSDVASSDVYVGIFAYRYGYVPEENNLERRSITELEYRKALEKEIPCLIFIMSEDAPWPGTQRDKGVEAQNIERLREELGQRHVVSFFENADQLARLVNESIIEWEKKTGVTGKRQLTDWVAYREAVSNKHQWVRLQVIAGASKDRGPLRIPLTEIFETQLATTGIPGADIPDEVRKQQEIMYRPKADPVEEREELQLREEPVDGETEEGLLFANPELVSDLLGRERTQVILGGPGSGKSTILHYTMMRLCQANDTKETFFPQLPDRPYPFLIDLRNYVLQKSTDFVSYIGNSSRDLYGINVEAENVINLFEQKGQAIVMFDGLDEVFDPDERKRVITQFESFANHYRHTHIIVTSRIAGYDRSALGLAGFQHYTLLPLTLGQIRHFAHQWYQYFTLEGTDRTAQGLVQRITENPRLLDLAGNPLLLTMMAVIYKDRDLPNERWRLYERCAETLLEDWDVGKGIEDEDFKLKVLIRTAQKSEILQRVSMYMLEHGQKGRELNAIGYSPLLEIMTRYLEEKYQRPRGEAEYVAVDILHHLMERTYVLAGVGERIFGFVHRTFMEYFAACYCQGEFNKRKSDFKWLTKEIFGAHWNEGEWEEVLLLLIAMLHDQGTPIREVIEHLRRKQSSSVPLNLAFAARCLGEAGDVQDPAQGQLVLTELAQAIAKFVSSKKLFLEPALKAFATLASLVAPPAEVLSIIEQLRNTNDLTARIASWQMGFALRSRKERLEYALAALNDEAETVRRGAIAALEREWPGRPNIGIALAQVVRNDRQARVRQAALAAMQRSWRSEPAILEAIASRVDEETGHRNVIRLIEYLAVTWKGNAKARDIVLRLAGPLPKAREGFDCASVRQSAAAALAKAWPRDQQVLAYLLEQARNDPKPETRAAALAALGAGWAGDAEVLQVVKERANLDSNINTRIAGIEAVARGWRNDADVLNFLRDRFASEAELEVRQAVLDAISVGWFGNSEALVIIREIAMSDADAANRAAAVRIIAKGWRESEGAIDFVKDRSANDSHPETRIAGLQAIEDGWGAQGWAPVFIQERAVNDENPVTRRGALQTLCKRLMLGLLRGQWFLWRENGSFEFEFLIDRAVHEPDLPTRETVFKVFFSVFQYYGLYVLEPSVQKHLSHFLRERFDRDPEIRIKLLALAVMAQAQRSAALSSFNESKLSFLNEQATDNEDPFNRSLAAFVIADSTRYDDHRLRFLQSCATNDVDSAVRLSVLRIIMNYGVNRSVIRSFIEKRAAEDSDPKIRDTIRGLLEEADRGSYKYYSAAELMGLESLLF